MHQSIIIGLRLRGVDVLTAQEEKHRTGPDNVLLDRATELGRVLFSQDEDLLAEQNKVKRRIIPLQVLSMLIS